MESNKSINKQRMVNIMKKFILVFILFPIIAAAQSNIPLTPFTGFFSEKRSTADKITRKFYDGRGSSYFQEDIVCRRSSDGLIDTLIYGDNVTEIRAYNDKNQLIHYKSFFNYSPNKLHYDDSYSYDSDGSIKQIDAILATTRYYKTSTNIDSIVTKKFNDYLNKEVPYNKSTITYTSYGYKCSSFEFDIETGTYSSTPKVTKFYFSNDRLDKVETASNSGDYISDIYEYKPQGYTHTNYERKDAPYYKYDYTFNSKGDIEETIYYKWNRVESKWGIEDIYKYEYTYPSTTGISPISKQSKIYYSNGYVIVNIDTPAPLYVYNIQGMLIKRVNLPSGESSIDLNKGLYIIKCDNIAQKVICN